MSPTTSRVLQAVSDELADVNLDGCAGGTIEIVVKLDAAGCPRRIGVRTATEHEVERRRPVAMTG